ncbi:hypothetical protein HUU42_14025 [bacterium]|nr:hypothetical protein [bacterium]
MDHQPLFATENNRRKNYELRAIVDFLGTLDVYSGRSAWDCIAETHFLMLNILRESKDLSVSQQLLNTFETNRRVIEEIYNPTAKKSKQLALPLSSYFTKLLALKNRFLKKNVSAVVEHPDIVRNKVDEFLREYVVKLIKDQRVVFLMLLTIVFRKIKNLPTKDFRDKAIILSNILKANELRPDKALTILIYNLCQASVDALETTDYAYGSLYCERAVEVFKLIGDGSKVKEAIRAQIEEALRITTERLVNRIQEKEEIEQITIIEDVVAKLSNIDLIAYLLPQLVFFLIRAQKYEECLGYLDRILKAENLSKDFLNYQTAITIGHEWCDSLLKAERYSRGKVTFSFVQNQKDNVERVFELSKTIVVPSLEDETFYNIEIEKLAVTFSHLGTLYFLTGNVEKAAEAYEHSFGTILLKRCSRNRDSVDEILDRYKDTLHHPLNSAPMEAHPLIGLYASQKGYEFLLESQLQKYERDGIAFNRDEQNFATLDNPQKEMIADLMDATANKLKYKFQEPYQSYKIFIEQKYSDLKNRMQI